MGRSERVVVVGLLGVCACGRDGHDDPSAPSTAVTPDDTTAASAASVDDDAIAGGTVIEAPPGYEELGVCSLP